jgi:hypothetical protein
MHFCVSNNIYPERLGLSTLSRNQQQTVPIATARLTADRFTPICLPFSAPAIPNCLTARQATTLRAFTRNSCLPGE